VVELPVRRDELKDSALSEAAFGNAYDSGLWRRCATWCFTALTDTRFFRLNYNIRSPCFDAEGAMHGFNEYVDLELLRNTIKAMAPFIAE
jgi:acetylornithine deacetylase